ncbi:MAG: hypothetical protein Q7S87_01720 [Agitococcus sp.]|nr:hypothetical protein [Agitococcus sp.]MDO9178360.1 hypothetical protein [Agitococcus sp.]
MPSQIRKNKTHAQKMLRESKKWCEYNTVRVAVGISRAKNTILSLGEGQSSGLQ